MKKIIPFLSLLLCYPLAACHQHTAEGITYVMEEELLAYPNHQYLPLLDIIQQFKDFHEEELTTKENPYASHLGEEEAAKQWDQYNEKYNQAIKKFITTLERHVLDLLNATTTISGYLAELASIQYDVFSYNIQAGTKYLLGKVTDSGEIIFPTSKKLVNFLMEDKEAFTGYEDSNERDRLLAITRFELLNQLIQTAIDITGSNAFNEKSTALLNHIQAIAACEHPDAAGGPYELLERLIFGNGLTKGQNWHRTELKRLLKFDQIRKQHPGNLRFVCELFKALYNTTNLTVIPHFLQLIKDRPIKIWFLENVQKPADIQYEVDSGGNTRITSPLEPVLKRLTRDFREGVPQQNATTDKWLAYIQGPITKKTKHHSTSLTTTTPSSQSEKKQLHKPTNTKNNKQQPASLKTTTPSSQSEKKQPNKPTNTPPQRTQDASHTKPQEEPNKKKLKKPVSKASSIHDSLEDNMIPISTSPLSEKLTPVTPLQPTPTTALSLLPTIKEQENIDHPTVSPTTISSTLTTQATSNNTSLALPITLKEPTMDHLAPTVESSELATASKLAKKKVPIKTIIIEKPAEQLASPEKEKTQQQVEEKTQQEEPIKKIVSLENTSPIPQPTLPQGPIQAIPQRNFIMPRGLRSFHAAQLQTAYPTISYPRHQATINQLFDPETQCNITYKVFETLWIANGGDIKKKSGSHCTLQFPQGTNLFGIYKPHGSSDIYGKKAIQYLQAAVLHIGLRPDGWY